MPKIKDNIIRIFNRIFRRNNYLMLENVSKQNYDEYYTTYNTLAKINGELDDIDAYIVGGIAAAIQTNQDLYRQNGDIDIMCKEEDLPRLIKRLEKVGYMIEDKRGTKTDNAIDVNGNFKAKDHDLNANIRSSSLLGIGIFVYQMKNNGVTRLSYALDERIGKYICTEKVFPKELFDLIYTNTVVDYKGIKLKTQSKEYVYVYKSKGKREKDQLDASIIEPTLDEVSMEKVDKIRRLQTKIQEYNITFDEDGNNESRISVPSVEERVNSYLNTLYINSSSKTPEEIVNGVLKKYSSAIIEHPEFDILINEWKEKTKNYTYRDKIKLVTIDYSEKLRDFNKETIDNALEFLRRRYQNHGYNNNDIELSPEASKIFGLLAEYSEAIKRIFIDNNIDITHITNIAPEKLEDGKLRMSMDSANNYETERVNGVFASSYPIDGNNPYIARNSSGMIKLGKSLYIYGSDNIEVSQDSEGKKHAILRQPNYIYHLNPDKFNPVCNLTIDPRSHEPIFEFSEEWISDSEVDISDHSQVRNIEQVKDVTSLLEHYMVLCDTQSQGIGMKAIQAKTKDEAIKFIEMKIKDGSVRNINKETGINDRDLSSRER